VRTADHQRDDAGGVWINTGIVVGVLVYFGIVLMDVAGFTVIAPLVVVPPVMVALIIANHLIGGGRNRGRSAARSSGAQAPLSSAGSNGSSKPAGPVPSLPTPPIEEPPGPR
jgi:hypothetical protein